MSSPSIAAGTSDPPSPHRGVRVSTEDKGKVIREALEEQTGWMVDVLRAKGYTVLPPAKCLVPDRTTQVCAPVVTP